ncbi:MAG: 2-succinyl-5-enolpyruvyl-6-hydroxy-3-cyclohexene-1-carboxylic-acid synthase [Porphyromonadaceae bacterium]|nr:2-succinyl-5-enolpyruvyl-6-hydroxy-3-cyclohexene-1-carboxylic-acid synthase [Porphyromonadaceae bacterium]
MYSDKQAILQLIALLKLHGIRHIVLCPGSRNAPIVHSLSVNSYFRCHGVTDERSAGFYALGIALQTDEAVAVCCTSGSALLNLHPAVAEAHYQRISLLILSADRPEAWIGQMDGQTIPQIGVFGSLCSYTTTLPLGESSEELWLCNRRINEALITLYKRRAPVHINIPLAEPLFALNTPTLPNPRYIKLLPSNPEEVWMLAQKAERPLIIVGQLSYQEARRIEPCLMKLVPHAVVIAEHLANLYSAIGNIDALLTVLNEKQRAALHPDLVITLGGHIISKQLKLWLRTFPPKWHWHISHHAEIVDLFAGALTHVGHTSLWLTASKDASKAHQTKTTYQERWHLLSSSLTPPSVLPYSSIVAVRELISRLPKECALHLGNSMSVRLAQLYPLGKDIRVQCNRGINGIEGSLSAALGYAYLDETLNFIILGDLSFFYDMNALCLPLPSTLRILMLNNGGGGIFSTLPQIPHNSSSYPYIMGQQQRNARLWAEDSGLKYYSVHSLDALEEALITLCSPKSEQGIFLEVHTQTDIDNAALATYYDELAKNLKTD